MVIAQYHVSNQYSIASGGGKHSRKLFGHSTARRECNPGITFPCLAGTVKWKRYGNMLQFPTAQPCAERTQPKADGGPCRFVDLFFTRYLKHRHRQTQPNRQVGRIPFARMLSKYSLSRWVGVMESNSFQEALLCGVLTKPCARAVKQWRDLKRTHRTGAQTKV